MKKYLAIFITAIISVFFLAGCFNPVFYEVRKDVAPEEATVNGTINGITRYTIGTQEYIVLAANGGIKYKDREHAGHGGWISYNKLPFPLHHYNFSSTEHEGQQILKVLANGDTLFLVTASYKDNDNSGTVCPDKCYVWAKQFISGWDEEDGWKCIIGNNNNVDNKKYFPIYMENLDDGYLSVFNVFQTNSTHKENRHVYLRSGDPNCDNDNYKTVTYYELTYLFDEANPTEKSSVTTLDSVLNCANSAFDDGSNVHFFNSSAIISDETYTKNAEHLYIAKDSSIYYGKVTDLPNYSAKYEYTSSVSASISSLAYCTDALIVGCADYSVTTLSSTRGGIYRITLDTTNEIGKPAGSPSDFTTNATFQLPSTYYIPCVLNATPEYTELESNLYASAIVFGAGASSQATYANVGLWSYYPGRGNWNRE